jgi:hypothetical protein
MDISGLTTKKIGSLRDGGFIWSNYLAFMLNSLKKEGAS